MRGQCSCLQWLLLHWRHNYLQIRPHRTRSTGASAGIGDCRVQAHGLA
uniref:Uncharacterized protein n=1 Tax=Arundo donax TaxID=35708 RepID=A0A0A9C105_ARUDO